MLSRHLDRLGHPFADRHAGHHDDELGPAIAFVHLEHGFDVDIGLARACLHLDVEVDLRAGLVAGGLGLALVIGVMRQTVRRGQHRAALHLADVLQQDVLGQLDRGVAKTLHLHLGLPVCAGVDGVFQNILPGLALKAIDHRIDGIGLIGLRLELDFHDCRFLKSGCSFLDAFLGCSRFIRMPSIPARSLTLR